MEIIALKRYFRLIITDASGTTITTGDQKIIYTLEGIVSLRALLVTTAVAVVDSAFLSFAGLRLRAGGFVRTFLLRLPMFEFHALSPSASIFKLSDTYTITQNRLKVCQKYEAWNKSDKYL